MSLVQFNNVSKTYGKDIKVIDDISFQVEEGEFVFLIGPSGSGKTTVIKMLIRDEKPSVGKIYFKDRDITKINRKQVYKLRREVGVIFQDYKLVPERTVFENVAFAMEAAGKRDKEIFETVPYVLDIVGLSHRMNSFPKQLSGGEQQRVAIARAIANNPKILIADEPTGNLDPASAWDIVQILTKINNWGTTIIMSTHGTDIVNSLNKRVIQMEKGKVVRDDNKGQYELTSNFEKNVLEKEDNQEEEQPKLSNSKKKSTFKVNISSKSEEKQEDIIEPQPEQKSESKGLSRFFKRKTNETSEPQKDIVQELKESEDENIEKTEEVEINEKSEKKEVKNPFKEESSDSQEEEKIAKKPLHITLDKKDSEENQESKEKEDGLFLKKFSKMKVEELNLPKKIVNELKEAGFEKVDKIIEEGPEGIEEKIDMDKKDLIKLSKAIDKVVEDQ